MPTVEGMYICTAFVATVWTHNRAIVIRDLVIDEATSLGANRLPFTRCAFVQSTSPYTKESDVTTEAHLHLSALTFLIVGTMKQGEAGSMHSKYDAC